MKYLIIVLLNSMDTVPKHTGLGTLIMPQNASSDNPVPAMVILHGSGGIKSGRELEYAKLFAENGIAGFVLDYYSSRGVTEQTPYLHKTLAATEVDIIVDAYSALKFLGTHPFIDASWVGVTGYSYGGMATRYTMDSRIKAILAPDRSPVDGVAVNQPTDDMNRDQRAFVRASVGQVVTHCVGNGYIIGKDDEADAKAKKRMLSFMNKVLGL